MYDEDQQEVMTATLRERSKITKGSRGGYGAEQTIEIFAPISHWIKDKATGDPVPMVVVGFDQDGGPITQRYQALYEAALKQAGASLAAEIARRQQADGGLRFKSEDE